MSSTEDSHLPDCIMIDDDDLSSLVRIVEALCVKTDFEEFWNDCERGELNEYCFCDKASSAVDVALLLQLAWLDLTHRSWDPKAIVVSPTIQILTVGGLDDRLDFTVWYADRGFESVGEDPLKHRNHLASATIYALSGNRYVVLWTPGEKVDKEIAWALEAMPLGAC